MIFLKFLIACAMLWLAIQIGGFIIMAAVWLFLAVVGLIGVLIGAAMSIFTRKEAK